MAGNEWTTAVGRVDEGTIVVRGVPLVEVIRELPFGAAVFLTIRGEPPTPAQGRVFDAALCSILEHAFYSPTTLAARIVTSTTPDSIIPGLAAGLLTVGSVTVSPQHSAEIITEVRAAVAGGATLEAAASAIAERLVADRRRMPGLGHPLHPHGDPRALTLEQVAREQATWGEGGDAFHAVKAAYLDRIGKDLPTNIDGMLGCVLTDLGFVAKEMPGVAALSFMPGIIAHCVEESTEPPRLRTADGAYTGPGDRHLDGAGMPPPSGNGGSA